MAMARKSLDNITKNDNKIANYITTTSEGSVAGTGKAAPKVSTPKESKTPTLFTVVNNDSGLDSVKGAIDKSFDKLSATPGSAELYKSASYGGYSSGAPSGSSYGSGSSSGLPVTLQLRSRMTKD